MDKLYNGRGLSTRAPQFVLYEYFLRHKNKDRVITYHEMQDFLSKQWEIEYRSIPSGDRLYQAIESAAASSKQIHEREL